MNNETPKKSEILLSFNPDIHFPDIDDEAMPEAVVIYNGNTNYITDLRPLLESAGLTFAPFPDRRAVALLGPLGPQLLEFAFNNGWSLERNPVSLRDEPVSAENWLDRRNELAQQIADLDRWHEEYLTGTLDGGTYHVTADGKVNITGEVTLEELRALLAKVEAKPEPLAYILPVPQTLPEKMAERLTAFWPEILAAKKMDDSTYIRFQIGPRDAALKDCHVLGSMPVYTLSALIQICQMILANEEGEHLVVEAWGVRTKDKNISTPYCKTRLQ